MTRVFLVDRDRIAPIQTLTVCVYLISGIDVIKIRSQVIPLSLSFCHCHTRTNTTIAEKAKCDKLLLNNHFCCFSANRQKPSSSNNSIIFNLALMNLAGEICSMAEWLWGFLNEFGQVLILSLFAPPPP